VTDPVPDVVTWATPADVAAFLGPSVTVDDAYLNSCTDAGNRWAYRKRLQAGYTDDPLTSPGADVTLGTAIYAGMLYRERGSDDSFASFDESAGFATTGGYSRIKQLLGIGRGRTDAPPAAAVAPVLRHPSSVRGRVWVP
jgi:hypothetical protein